MKANSRLLGAALLALSLAGCSGGVIPPAPPAKRPVPAPAPAPTPPTSSRPAPQLAPTPPPASWQDMPATPGDWSWSMEAGRSTARFADGLLSLSCDRSGGTVLIYRQGQSSGGNGLTITTTSVSRTVAGSSASGAIVASFPSRDPLLDAIAFSRGRFAVQAPGLATLYVPSWPEISRVIQDCR